MALLFRGLTSERIWFRVAYVLSLVGLACALWQVERHVDVDANRLYWEYAGRLLHAPVTNGYIEWVQHRVGVPPSPATAMPAARHLAPYTDFPCEYPPGSLLLFVAVRYFYDDLSGFSRAFQFAAAALFIAVMVITLACTRNANIGETGGSRLVPYAALPLVAISPILIGPFAVNRFDTLPTFFAIAGLALFLRQRPRAAALTLGLGAATKLWPGIFIPLIAINYWRSGTINTRPAAIAAFGMAGFVVPHVLMILIGTHPADAFDYLRYLGDRPPQIESMAANITVLVSAMTGSPVSGGFDFGSQNVYSSASPYVVKLATVTNAALLIFAFLVILKRTVSGTMAAHSGVVTIYACGFAVCVTMLCSRVFSGEYMMWPLPFTLFLFMDKRGVIGAAAFVLSLILLKVTYWAYDDLIDAKLYANLISFSKNLMLAVVAGIFGWRMVNFDIAPEIGPRPRRLPRSARSTPPATTTANLRYADRRIGRR